MSPPAHDTPSLRDRIFPPDPPRDGRILRLALVNSWESQLIGLGRLTALQTERLMRQTHAPDDMGLNLVFLQRHRVEVGLKLTLERAGAPVLGTHSISDLLAACRRDCNQAGYASEWSKFETAQNEFIGLMSKVDPDSATFRYPVDKHGQRWSRDDSVDLDELEAAAKEFQQAVALLVRELNLLEPLPAAEEELEATTRELAALVRACNDVVAFQREGMADLRAQVDRLSAARRRPDRSNDAYAAAGAVEEVTAALAQRAQEMLDRTVARSAVESPPQARPRPRFRLPQLRPTVDLRQLKRSQDAQMKAWVDEFSARVAPLTRAVDHVARRSAGWTTPAARQLHLDVVRFQSRLINVKRLEDPGDAGAGDRSRK